MISWRATVRPMLRLPAHALAGVTFAAACAAAPKPAPTGNRGHMTAATDDIRRVDFRNREYHPDCASDEAVTAKDGSFTRDDEDNRLDFQITAVEYGDVTGDGLEEALVLTHCNSGGPGQFTEGVLFTLRGGDAVEIARLDTGDRADGGIDGAWIKNGLVVTDRYAGDDASGACCPVWIDRETLRWDGQKLVAVGEPARRKVDDPTPPR